MPSVRDKICYRLVEGLGRVQQFILRYGVEEHCWRSQDGRVTPIGDLDSKHLRNIWGILERERDYDNYLYDSIVREALSRGITISTPRTFLS